MADGIAAYWAICVEVLQEDNVKSWLKIIVGIVGICFLVAVWNEATYRIMKKRDVERVHEMLSLNLFKTRYTSESAESQVKKYNDKYGMIVDWKIVSVRTIPFKKMSVINVKVERKRAKITQRFLVVDGQILFVSEEK